MSGTERSRPWVNRSVRASDVIVKVGGAVILVSSMIAATAGLLKPAVRDFVGTTANAAAIGKVEKRLYDLTERVGDLEPSKTVVKFDMNRTRREISTCDLGSECSVLVVMNRTRHGRRCGRPTVTIYVINGMGTKHSAEFRGHAPSVEHQVWTRIHWKFVVPTAVHAGNADVQALIEWDCPNGPESQESPFIPITITEGG